MTHACIAALVLALGCSGADFSSAKQPGGGGMAGMQTAPGPGGESTGSSAGEPPIGEAGSGSGSGSGGTLTVRDRICEPGATQDCAGPGRCPGAQACSGDGRSWGACECSSRGSGAGGSSDGEAGQAGSMPELGGNGGGYAAGGSAPLAGGAGIGQTAGSGGSANGGSSGNGASGTAGGLPIAGAGGSVTASCEVSGWTVSNNGYVMVPAVSGECWRGYAFASGDVGSTIHFPDGIGDFGLSRGKLEISGTVGAATSDNMYAGNVYFGVNIGQSEDASAPTSIRPTGTGITIACIGCDMPPMRAELTDGTSIWCSEFTSGSAIDYGSFRRNCADTTPGTYYARQPISEIRLSIPGHDAAMQFDVTITSIIEN